MKCAPLPHTCTGADSWARRYQFVFVNCLHLDMTEISQIDSSVFRQTDRFVSSQFLSNAVWKRKGKMLLPLISCPYSLHLRPVNIYLLKDFSRKFLGMHLRRSYNALASTNFRRCSAHNSSAQEWREEEVLLSPAGSLNAVCTGAAAGTRGCACTEAPEVWEGNGHLFCFEVHYMFA